MRALALVLILAASPAAAQGVPTNPFASNLPSYPRPHDDAPVGVEPPPLVPTVRPRRPVPPRPVPRTDEGVRR